MAGCRCHMSPPLAPLCLVSKINYPASFIVSIALGEEISPVRCPGSRVPGIVRPPPPVTMVTTCPSRLSTPDSHMTCFLKTCKESFKHKALYYSYPWSSGWGPLEKFSSEPGPCHNSELAANLLNNSNKHGSE